MSATPDQIARLRRMTAEVSSSTYSDADLAEYIEACPLLDALGSDPFQVSAAVPPALEANPDWSPTFDLNNAAASIWDEKSAALASKFDFTTDGQTFARSQLIKHAQGMARYYRSRQSARTVRLWPWPPASSVETVANAPEPD